MVLCNGRFVYKFKLCRKSVDKEGIKEMAKFVSPVNIIILLLSVLIVIGVIIAISLARKTKSRKNRTDNDGDGSTTSKGLMDFAYNITKISTSVFNDRSMFMKLLQAINNSYLLLTKADGAILLMPNKENEGLQTNVYEGYFPPTIQVPKSLSNNMASIANYYISNTHSNASIFGSIMDTGKPELVNNIIADKRIYVNEVFIDEKSIIDFTHEDSAQYLKASSYIFMPLICNKTCLGVVGLARRYTSDEFTTNDYDLAKSFSRFVNTALNNVFTFDIVSEERNSILQSTIATDLQKQIFCKNYPFLPKLSVDSYFYGAEGVCSDYLDVIQSRKDRVCFVLSDALGRGMKSLMLVTMIRGICRILANTPQTVATILSWVNKAVVQDKSMVNFANISFVDYNPLTSVIRCSTAGAGTILFFDAASKTWENLSVPSEPIGIDINTEYTEVEKTLNANDIVVICTDGIVETVNSIGSQYGQSRLQEKIKRFASLSTKEITEKIKSDLLDFEGNISSSEDRSLVILKGKQK